MRRLRLTRWSGQLLSPRTRPLSSSYCLYQQPQQSHHPRAPFIRPQSTLLNPLPPADNLSDSSSGTAESLLDAEPTLDSLSSSPPSFSPSAKLSALHARLALPSKLPLETLAVALLDPSAVPYLPPGTPNNDSLAVLGNNLLSYYLSEHLICHYPRLPMSVLYAAMYAYVGQATLTTLVREWGVEPAAVPGSEVDPGLLQFKRIVPGQGIAPNPDTPTSTRPNASRGFKRSLSSRVVYDDEFGDETSPATASSLPINGRTLAQASTSFARALFGAIYLHAGAAPTKSFFQAHILSRHLALTSLFSFRQPTRDLSRLCAREGYEGPVARIISETGRTTRHPVFVVGVYSGDDKLGEGAGGSLDEARTRAAVNALMGWYLYSPMDVRVPSETEGGGGARKREWKAVMIDGGEVVV